MCQKLDVVVLLAMNKFSMTQLSNRSNMKDNARIEPLRGILSEL
jgi:hypothetical protein